MSTLTVPITFTNTQMPGDTAAIAKYICTLKSAATGTQVGSAITLTTAATSVTFSGVSAGDYTVTVQAADSASNPIGPALTSAVITVALPAVARSLPSAFGTPSVA